MNDEALSLLIKTLMNNDGISWNLKRKLENAINPDSFAIWWSIGDVEYIAADLEENEDAEIGTIYDRSEFHDLLEGCCDNTTEFGMNWETIQYALDNYKL